MPTIYNISTINGIETERVTGYFIAGAYEEGAADYMNNIFKQYDEKKVKRLGVHKAIALSRQWIREASMLDNYIGGPVDILLIQPDKARWINHKGGKHKLLSQRIPFNIL